jgi:hypothetical protein
MTSCTYIWWKQLNCDINWLLHVNYSPVNIKRKAMVTLTMLACWKVSNERNARVLRNKSAPTTILLNIIKAKAKLWVTVGAKFLSYVIPGVRRVVPLYALSIFLSKLFFLTNGKGQFFCLHFKKNDNWISDGHHSLFDSKKQRIISLQCSCHSGGSLPCRNEENKVSALRGWYVGTICPDPLTVANTRPLYPTT